MDLKYYLKFFVKNIFLKNKIVTSCSDSIFDLDYGLIYDKGIRLIIFDIDDTLTGHYDVLSENVLKLLNKLKKGYFYKGKKILFDLAFLSNASKKRRKYLKKIGEENDIFVLDSSLKPNPKKYKEIMNYFNLKGENVLMVGDRIVTDLMGAFYSNIKLRVLVNPYSYVIGGSKLFFGSNLLRSIENKLFH